MCVHQLPPIKTNGKQREHIRAVTAAYEVMFSLVSVYVYLLNPFPPHLFEGGLDVDYMNLCSLSFTFAAIRQYLCLFLRT